MAVETGGCFGVNLRDVPERGQGIFVIAILFFAASTLCLPVPPTEEIATLYPWWARRFDFGNVLLYEVLFICWMLLYGIRHLFGGMISKAPARIPALILFMLAVWCGVVSLSAPLPWQDFGRTLRLMLNAILILAVVRWGRWYGTMPLAVIVMGFLVGTLVNLAMSFQYPLIIEDVMRLSGQNTPGVAIGIAIHLAAWWFYLTDKLRAKLLLIGAYMVFAFACAISFSRIGWFAGATGSLAWCYVIYSPAYRCASRQRRAKRLRTWVSLVFAAMFVLLPTTNIGQSGADWMTSLVIQKTSYEGAGDKERLGYLVSTIEIIADHPFGVGYSGFYNSVIKTDAYRWPDAAEFDDPEEANPHSTFLWYASAGGIPGLMLVISVFACLLGRLHSGLRAVFGNRGFVLFSLISPAYLVMGLTVPYLFSNIILIFPAAYVLGLGLALRKNPCSIAAIRKLDKAIA